MERKPLATPHGPIVRRASRRTKGRGRVAGIKTLMLFGGRRDPAHSSGPHVVTILRDVAEVLAIIAAGIWAFYVFAYENRIKPSLANPDIDVSASIQKLGERNGLIAVGLHLQLHNIGTVKAHFTGIAINVFGQRVVAGASRVPAQRPLHYEFGAFYHTGPRVPVFSWAYVTHLGDASTKQDTELDPGTTIDNYRAFYVPRGRFDLLTVGIDAPYTKYDSPTVPTHLVVSPQGDVKVVTTLSPNMQQYNINPVTSLDIR